MKSLCGQGDLYVRLKRDFHLPPVSSPEYSSSDGEEVEKSVNKITPSNATPTTRSHNYEAQQQTSSRAPSQLSQVPSSTLSPSSPGPSSMLT